MEHTLNEKVTLPLSENTLYIFDKEVYAEFDIDFKLTQDGLECVVRSFEDFSDDQFLSDIQEDVVKVFFKVWFEDNLHKDYKEELIDKYSEWSETYYGERFENEL